MMPPQALLDQATDAILETDIRILQGFRLAGTDADHVCALLRYMAPAQGATVVDVGSGFGEVARLMKIERADLNFVLVNFNRRQLAHSPGWFPRLCADMHTLPLADGVADCLMYLYSLCHAELVPAMAEAARVTKPGGTMFVFDYERLAGGNRLMEEALFAHSHTTDEVITAAEATGWSLVMHTNPSGTDDVFRSLFPDQDYYDQIFDDLLPVIWKLARG